MRPHKLGICAALALMLALLCAFGAAADTTVGMTGAGTFRMEQVYVNVPELDVYFYALDGDGNPYSSIKVQAAGPELTLGDRRLEVRSVAVASDPICYILALDNSADLPAADFYTMLGGVRKLINAMDADDQLMLYTTAGAAECVLPATSDKALMYKALGAVQQAEGRMDSAQLVSAVYTDIQSDFQALAPRKAAMIVTDAGQVLTNMALVGTLASDFGDQIGMAAYVYLMTEKPQLFETLQQASGGRLILCEAAGLGDELKAKHAYFATALEIRTEVPESLYGERLETLTLAMPQLGSAIRSSQTVYMGHKLAKPQVTGVETLRRDQLRLTFNQPINENADKTQLYEIRSKDIWNWRVGVHSVKIGEDGRTAVLQIDPLYKGEYTVALNRVSSRMSAANGQQQPQYDRLPGGCLAAGQGVLFCAVPGAACAWCAAAADALRQLVGGAPPRPCCRAGGGGRASAGRGRGTGCPAAPLGHAVLEPALLHCREPLGRHGREQPHHRQRCRPMRFLSAGPQALPAALRPLGAGRFAAGAAPDGPCPGLCQR